ncbi:MAG: hypothetical protein Q9191_006766 [Dirinaria sp. TL-2023a]
MPSNDTLSDDYVASLLAKDAKDSTIKFSSYGLGALLPKRPTTNAPKPNTRFLKNIIRETDNHNAALKVKEAEDARARLRKLKRDSRAATANGERGDDERSLKRQRIDHDDDEDPRTSEDGADTPKTPARMKGIPQAPGGNGTRSENGAIVVHTAGTIPSITKGRGATNIDTGTEYARTPALAPPEQS